MGLAGIGASVELEIELADPDGGSRISASASVKTPRTIHRQSGESVDVSEAASRFEHLSGGSSATIAPAEQVERTSRTFVVLEVVDREPELADTDVAVVSISRWKVGEDPRAVDALPEETVVGHDVVLIPPELLGEEPPDAASVHDLGQSCRVAEYVRQPHIVGLDA